MRVRHLAMHLGRAWRFFGVPGLAGLFAIALVVLAIGHLYSGTIHDHAFAEARKEAMRVALRVERDAGETVTTNSPQRLRRAVRRASRRGGGDGCGGGRAGPL